MKKKKTVVILIIALILILAEKFFGGNASFPEREEGKLYMYAIDVGQADSTLILLPDGENILIDAGNREDTNLVVEFIKEKGIEKLDYVVATHPHEDHIGGMPGVIENFEIGTFYMPDSVHTTVYYEDMIDALIKWEVVTEFAEKGVKIKDGECSIDILSPLPREYDDFNHVSAVTRITYKDNSFLLMGDAEKINEYDIIDNYGDKIKSDVLKVGHHGSDT
ncbi:MAG: MBL fold metallo-hydrolase, partial [Clostridia bacterium]|nr:MBL fold metallo-hydrolase [Clostridia bacterium]